MRTQQDLRKILQMQEPEQYAPISVRRISRAFIPQDVLEDLKGTELLSADDLPTHLPTGLGIVVYDLRQLRERLDDPENDTNETTKIKLLLLLDDLGDTEWLVLTSLKPL